ncbi:MAG: hypothetical protein ACR2FZ_02200 [Thermoleophilaceae bacterium]
MGRRGRQRRRDAGGGERPSRSTSGYPGADGSVLRLRDELTVPTLQKLEALEARAGASAEDRWQRRMEYLFEHLVVGWEISGLPLEGQKELLARYRMASAEERRFVREAIAEHLRTRYPEVAL